MSKTACIILNYRGAKSALRLIDSLEKCAWPDKQIFVVENGSGDDSAEILGRRIGAENVVNIEVNQGYAGGMNAGLKRALESDAEFFWILTKDLTVEPDCLTHLHSLWPRLDHPGMLGSLTDLNGTDHIYFYRAEIDQHGRTRHGTKGRTIPQIPELSREYGTTDYVNGACVFTHRTVLEKVGLIPEDYFLYFEDCDWGLQATRKGYKNYVSYRSRVHHHREVGAFNRTAEYYCRRNAFIFKLKNGFSKPWTKPVALLSLKKAELKSWWRKDVKMLEVLEAVIRDVREEKRGLGPWR